jgi:hypothetical protein
VYNNIASRKRASGRKARGPNNKKSQGGDVERPTMLDSVSSDPAPTRLVETRCCRRCLSSSINFSRSPESRFLLLAAVRGGGVRDCLGCCSVRQASSSYYCKKVLLPTNAGWMGTRPGTRDPLIACASNWANYLSPAAPGQIKGKDHQPVPLRQIFISSKFRVFGNLSMHRPLCVVCELFLFPCSRDPISFSSVFLSRLVSRWRRRR